MQIKMQMLLMIVAIVAGVMFSPVLKAECDSGCVGKAVASGQNIAYEVIDAGLKHGENLDELARMEAILTACGNQPKSAAVRKAREARLDELIRQGMPRLSMMREGDSEQGKVEFASYLSSAKALVAGYLLGRERMSRITFAMDSSRRDSTCAISDAGADIILAKNRAD